MKKKLGLVLALVMGFGVSFSASACSLNGLVDKLFPEESSSVESSSTIEGSSGDITVDEKKVATIVTANEATLGAWNAEGVAIYELTNFQATGATVVMETAYAFIAEETVEEAKASQYANWIADYYVSVDAAVEAGKIGLAGSYQSWDNGAWVAFYSPVAVEAGQQIGLLESTGGTPWTYAEIVELVGTFRCGAFDLDNACSGVTLTVELRLTNPADATDYVIANSTSYKFA